MSLCPSCNAEAGDVARFCPACGASIVRSTTNELIGRIVAGKYRVEAQIGEGGMGRVFRATQLTLDKKVVLKVLHQTLLSDARTVARFQREARAASRLNHPNSINVIDFGQAEDGSLFIAMEHVNGQDLHQLLSKEGPLPEARIVRILSQVLSALADAHAAAVIHRDLKPENIMVEQRRGEADFVKVLDFGIAKIQETEGESDDNKTLTRAGFVCGTPEYMSPEQARGGSLDARSDLYTVGVIAYQCATNCLPFEADSAVGLATMHLTAEPVPPRAKRPDARISEAMERLILRAMAKEPKERPQSAEEFRRELMALSGTAEVTAPLALVSRRGHAPAADEATQLTEPNFHASGFDVKTTVVPTPEPRRRRTGARATALVFLAGVVGATGVAVGGLLAYDALRSQKVHPVAVLELPAETPPAKPVLEAERARARAEAARAALLRGDELFAAGKHEQALAEYYEVQSQTPGAAASARIALVHLLKGDAPGAQKWLRAYAEAAKDAPAEAAFVERYLQGRP